MTQETVAYDCLGAYRQFSCGRQLIKELLPAIWDAEGSCACPACKRERQETIRWINDGGK